MRRILVIKLRYLGDVLLATPVLRALRERFPKAYLAAAVNRGTEDLLRWNPDVDEVLVIERRGLARQLRVLGEVRRRRFDCVIDLTDGDRAALLSFISGAPVRIGFNAEHRWRGWLYTTVVEPRPLAVHRIERNLEALRPLGIEATGRNPVLYLSPQVEAEAARLLENVAGRSLFESEERLIMFQPGARYWFKAWPLDRYAELANRLTALGYQILIGGHAQERRLAEEIASRAQGRLLVLAGQTTILEHAALLKRCALWVGSDNGPMHMAAALGVPVVALFGPSNPAEWGPRGERVAILYKGLDCRRCFHPSCFRGEESCMKLISVDEVFAAATQLLEGRPSGTRDH
jgi:predicted lipopolysaccharide heptosyltransferase III